MVSARSPKLHEKKARNLFFGFGVWCIWSRHKTGFGRRPRLRTLVHLHIIFCVAAEVYILGVCFIVSLSFPLSVVSYLYVIYTRHDTISVHFEAHFYFESLYFSFILQKSKKRNKLLVQVPARKKIEKKIEKLCKNEWKIANVIFFVLNAYIFWNEKCQHKVLRGT